MFNLRNRVTPYGSIVSARTLITRFFSNEVSIETLVLVITLVNKH